MVSSDAAILRNLVAQAKPCAPKSAPSILRGLQAAGCRVPVRCGAKYLLTCWPAMVMRCIARRILTLPLLSALHRLPTMRTSTDADSDCGHGRPILAPLSVQVVASSMKIVSYSEARSSLKSVLDTVHDDADVTIISRRDGADAVVMSLDHYQSIMETMHLLSSPANAAHLAKSIAQHKRGRAVRRDLVKP